MPIRKKPISKKPSATKNGNLASTAKAISSFFKSKKEEDELLLTDEKTGSVEGSSETGGSSGSGGGARFTFSGAKASADRAISRERSSALAGELRADFLKDVRVDLKSKGHKVDALDKKHEQTHRREAAAKMGAEVNQSAAGGVNVEPHPLMPKPEGIADDFVLPEAEDLTPANAETLVNRHK